MNSLHIVRLRICEVIVTLKVSVFNFPWIPQLFTTVLRCLRFYILCITQAVFIVQDFKCLSIELHLFESKEVYGDTSTEEVPQKQSSSNLLGVMQTSISKSLITWIVV